MAKVTAFGKAGVALVALLMPVLSAGPGAAKGGRAGNSCQASYAAAKATRAVLAGQTQAEFMAFCAVGISAMNLARVPTTPPAANAAQASAAAVPSLLLGTISLPVLVPNLAGMGTVGTRATASAAAAAVAGSGVPAQNGKATPRRPVLMALPSPVPSTASLLPTIPVFNAASPFGVQVPRASAIQPVRTPSTRPRGKRRGG